MKRLLLIVMLAGPMFAVPILTGCDETSSEKTTVKENSSGTTVTDSKKTTETPNGDTKVTTEHKVDHP